jgi:CheY-like chemotaxis protein
LHFEVCDTGVGISQKQLESLFQPFEQVGDLERRMGGTGLGLTITRQLLRLMGSEIHVDSTLREGSRFWFELSVPIAAAVASRPVERRLIGYHGARKTVLVVDDIEVNRAMLVDLLSELDFKVYVAINGKEGVEQAQLHRPDIVLMDVMMPVMDGLEATRRIREISGLEYVPILVVSASASNSDQTQSLAAGASAFIAKPINENKLLQDIGAFLELSWIAEQPEKEVGLDYENSGPLVIPPETEMETLYQLSLTGNMRDINEWAARVATLDKQYRPFSEKLRQLTQQFDTQAILALVERSMGKR